MSNTKEPPTPPWEEPETPEKKHTWAMRMALADAAKLDAEDDITVMGVHQICWTGNIVSLQIKAYDNFTFRYVSENETVGVSCSEGNADNLFAILKIMAVDSQPPVFNFIKWLTDKEEYALCNWNENMSNWWGMGDGMIARLYEKYLEEKE